jgi:hypothetical protein
MKQFWLEIMDKIYNLGQVYVNKMDFNGLKTSPEAGS